VKVLVYLGIGCKEEDEEWEVLVEGGPISSKSDDSEVERATDLVRCEDVRSCAIDYAIRRDRIDFCDSRCS
jgi:hypothetical protein